MKKFILPATVSTILAINLNAGELTTKPLFQSCSIYYTGKDIGKIRYRKDSSNDKWRDGMPLVNSKDLKTWRASINDLQEATGYEVQIVDKSGKVTVQQKFKTMGLKVPIASERKLPANGPITITAKGSPKGWIRYTSNQTIKGGSGTDAAIMVDKAEYVIFENLRVTGGGKHAFKVSNAKNIRIINCDISGWGRKGKRDYRRKGFLYDKNKDRINNDAGVFVDQSLNVLVERCFIHDPRGTANSWVFTHPAGPNAVFVHAKGGTVLRYNDFIGSDRHRWNDVVEGNRNGFPDGGFCRDAEIYGNIMLYGNDDGIELDGGQMNIKVWGNHFEGSLCGISTAPCINGPTYAWNNLFVNPGDIDNIIGSAIKNGYKYCGQGQIYLNNNTAVYKTGMNAFGKGKAPRRHLTTRYNVFDTLGSFAYGSLIREKNDLDYDLIWSPNKDSYTIIKELLKENGLEKNGIFAKPVFNAPEKGDYLLLKDTPGYGTNGIYGDIPYRPTPLKLDRKYIDFIDSLSPVQIIVSYPGKGTRKFKVMKNEVFDWFSVSPESGIVGAGKNVVLTVKPTGKAPKRLKGAFIVKLDDGFSRPAVVYAGTSKLLKLTSKTPGCVALINAGGKESSPLDMVKGKAKIFTFEVPSPGWYYAALKFNTGGGLAWIKLSVDNGPEFKSMMRAQSGWTWAGLSLVDKRRKGLFEPVKLSKGKHQLKFTAERDFKLDQIAILTSPEVVTTYIKDEK